MCSYRELHRRFFDGAQVSEHLRLGISDLGNGGRVEAVEVMIVEIQRQKSKLLHISGVHEGDSGLICHRGHLEWPAFVDSLVC